MTSISRVSTIQTTDKMLNYIQTAESKYNELSEEASSGIKVNDPSDDPNAAKKILQLTSTLNDLSTYAKNISTAKSEMDSVSSTLTSVNNLIQKASDYATQAANGNYNADDLKTVKSQVDQLIQSVMDLANTNFDGKYVFSGTATGTQTYSMTTDASGNITGITYNGTSTSDYQRYTTISDGVSVATNVRGSDVFGSYSSTDPTQCTGLFNDLVKLSNALGSNDTTTINASINSLTTDLGTVTSSNTALAAVYNRLDMTNDTISETVTNLKSYRSNLQDADLTQVLTDLTTQENALKATYLVTSQMLNKTTLLNYM